MNAPWISAGAGMEAAPAITKAVRAVAKVSPPSRFHAVYSHLDWHDRFYRFLQSIYSIYPEDRFHTLIKQACTLHAHDEGVYRHIQANLSAIKPALADLTHALPSLFKQKAEMTRQTLELLGDKRDIDGSVEIGTTGRYASALRKRLRLRGPLVLVDLPDQSAFHAHAARGLHRRSGRSHRGAPGDLPPSARRERIDAGHRPMVARPAVAARGIAAQRAARFVLQPARPGPCAMGRARYDHAARTRTANCGAGARCALACAAGRGPHPADRDVERFNGALLEVLGTL